MTGGEALSTPPYEDITSHADRSTLGDVSSGMTSPATQNSVYQIVYLVVLSVCSTISFITLIFICVVICYVRYREKHGKHEEYIPPPRTGPRKTIRRVDVGHGAPPPSHQLTS